jgi:hypothetical protein
MPPHIRRSQACPARTAPGGGRSGLKVEAAWRPRPASPGGRLDTPGPGRVRRGSSCRIALTVMVLETGLPTRYYLNLTEINSKPLVASNTVTACPYKGTTSRYWSIHVGGTVHQDLAWAYDFPTRQLSPSPV